MIKENLSTGGYKLIAEPGRSLTIEGHQEVLLKEISIPTGETIHKWTEVANEETTR